MPHPPPLAPTSSQTYASQDSIPGRASVSAQGTALCALSSPPESAPPAKPRPPSWWIEISPRLPGPPGEPGVEGTSPSSSDIDLPQQLDEHPPGVEQTGGGRGRKWEEGREVETCILSFRHASGRGGGRSSSSNPGWPSTSARHLESGFVI